MEHEASFGGGRRILACSPLLVGCNFVAFYVHEGDRDLLVGRAAVGGENVMVNRRDPPVGSFHGGDIPLAEVEELADGEERGWRGAVNAVHRFRPHVADAEFEEISKRAGIGHEGRECHVTAKAARYSGPPQSRCGLLL